MTSHASDPRIDQLVEAVVALASGQLDTRLEPSDRDDEIDAITIGLNMLAEELQATHEELERRVRERTLALEAATDELQHLVLHDALTGSANRRLLEERMTHALSQRRDDRSFGVLFIDVDRFKQINDVLGHGAGDALLCRLADLLRAASRKGDTVARLGGDEFVVLCEDIRDRQEAYQVAERILDQVAQPMELAGQDVTVTASIGIAFPAKADTAERVLRHADAAMYEAKRLGRGQWAEFRDDMTGATAERLALTTELRQAINANQIVAYYQPVVDIETGEISEVEALVRWLHSERGVIPPGDFLEVAEETGLIVPIGRRMLQLACTEIAELRQSSGQPQLRVSVNISAQELSQPDLVDVVKRCLAESGLPGDALRLELTETALIAATQETMRRLEALKATGVTLSIDDFGTGYSSLTYLKRFPVDVLKADRSFIGGMASEREDEIIVSAVLGLSQALGLQSVAEGVESPEQLARLKELGCNFAQGYYFSPPIERAALAELLKANPATDVDSPGDRYEPPAA